jgi:FkbM family methyltransferase
VPAKTHHSLRERASFALRRPDLLWRIARTECAREIFLDEVAPYLTGSPVILEAGAFDGTDTVNFTERWPGATIYTFEPVPQLFTEVERRTSHLAQVRRYPMALSDRTGPATFHIFGNPNDESSPGRDSSSLLPLDEVFAPQITISQPIEVQAITIADWARAENVDRIDFMWLDMQGMELPALKAAGPVLATTSAIHMGVHRVEFFAGCALYDEIVSSMRSLGFHPAIDRVTLKFGNILFVR